MCNSTWFAFQLKFWNVYHFSFSLVSWIMENVLQTLDPKLCIICGKHFEKGKKKDPYVQNPTVEGLQHILTLAQQRDDDVHKTLAPYTDDILSSKIKVSYHVSCRANYCSKTKISEQQQVANVESESTSAPRRLSRADTTSFKIRRLFHLWEGQL